MRFLTFGVGLKMENADNNGCPDGKKAYPKASSDACRLFSTELSDASDKIKTIEELRVKGERKVGVRATCKMLGLSANYNFE